MATGPQQPTGKDRIVQEGLRSTGEIPRHIAMIMDGNGRWAEERGLPRIAGHREGVESVRDIVEACGQLGVEYLTLYAFSTENWKRPREEVSLLMRLLLRALRDETDRLNASNVRIQAIGDTSKLPREVQKELRDGIRKTAANTGLVLTLALSYSGRWDLTEAVRRLSRDVREGKLHPGRIDETVLGGYLSTAGIPDPDLLVRTGGEMRISNFLLWQAAYSEIVISPRFWPLFRRAELYDAIREYRKRERRFGMVSGQVKARKAAATLARRLLKGVTGS
ncbi:MAG: isoprenyl transferase [Bacteroidota bacterium]